VKYTCDGPDISPPLVWGAPPQGTVSLALLSIDITAANLTHWILFNIPPETRSLPEGIPTVGHFPDGSQQGTNNRLVLGYMGPCPPPQTNEYVFTLYALDIFLDLEDGVMKIPIRQAMRGHVLAETEITGVYYP
jgi:Raf kinase inhibitor-like YbhB/YbcL family protein